MARGKIPIKRIDNPTNRQVTYSKRRSGLFKKANELTVLCDAKVSLIMFSSTHKLHEYISPSITTKQVFDMYQQALGVDLWSTHYEKMQEELRKLKETNKKLIAEIGHRMGEGLNDLSIGELCSLETKIDKAVEIVRERKEKQLKNQIDTMKKKVRNGVQVHKNFLQQFDARGEDPNFSLVDGRAYDDAGLGYEDDGPSLFTLRLQTNNHQPNLQSAAGSELTYTLMGAYNAKEI